MLRLYVSILLCINGRSSTWMSKLHSGHWRKFLYVFHCQRRFSDPSVKVEFSKRKTICCNWATLFLKTCSGWYLKCDILTCCLPWYIWLSFCSRTWLMESIHFSNQHSRPFWFLKNFRKSEIIGFSVLTRSLNGHKTESSFFFLKFRVWRLLFQRRKNKENLHINRGH